MPSVTRTRMSRPDRAAQLLAVAEKVFTERGFGATSMDDVAERAGVTKPVLYDHFGSKDGLLAAVMRRLGDELREATVAAVEGAESSYDALARGLRAYFHFVEEHAPAWSLLLTELAASSVAAQAVEDVRRGQGHYIGALIAAEMPTPDPARAAVYAQAVIGASERLATVRRTDPSLSADVVADRLLELLWFGFERLRTH